MLVANYSNDTYDDEYDDQYDDQYDEPHRKRNGRKKGKEFKKGGKRERDIKYNIDEPEFWKWWEHIKGKEGGEDIKDKNMAKDAYDQWVSEGNPDITNMNKRGGRRRH